MTYGSESECAIPTTPQRLTSHYPVIPGWCMTFDWVATHLPDWNNLFTFKTQSKRHKSSTGIQFCDYSNSHKLIIELTLFECINKMSSKFSDDSAVRLADTVQPAALNDLSLAALDSLCGNGIMANSCRANMPAAVETASVPSTIWAYLDSQALDFAGETTKYKWLTKKMSVWRKSARPVLWHKNEGPVSSGRADGPPGSCRPVATTMSY